MPWRNRWSDAQFCVGMGQLAFFFGVTLVALAASGWPGAWFAPWGNWLIAVMAAVGAILLGLSIVFNVRGLRLRRLNQQ